MPITKSAKKHVRVAARKRVVNSTLRKAVRKTLKTAEGVEGLRLTYKAIDKAVKGGLIHKRKAARMKSGASKRLKTD